MRGAIHLLIINPLYLVTFMSADLHSRTASASGYLFAVAATIIWAGNFIIARGAIDVIAPVTLAFWRWVVAVLVILPFALPSLMREWHNIKNHIPYLSCCAFLGVTLFNTLIYFASHSTNALNLSLIAISFPVFIVFISRWYFKETISPNKVLGIFIVVLGVVVLITRGDIQGLLHLSFAWGDLWMLIASLAFAIYSVLIKKKPAEISIWSFQLTTFALGLLMLIPFYVWENSVSSPVVFTGQVIGAVLYLGIFASLTAFVFWNKSIAIIGPAKAGMVYYSLPIFSGALGTLFLNEAIELFHLICGLLIVTGIVLANVAPRAKTLTQVN